MEIKKEEKIAVFQNLKTGETQNRPFNSFYYNVQQEAHENVVSSGLADAHGQVDVDPFTLKHKKFSNVYALGDVSNVPTTKTFWGGFNQIHVLRNNLERELSGQNPNARYDGLSEANFLAGYDKIVKLSHTYDGKANDSLSTGFTASLKYKWASSKWKDALHVVTFDNWGPPYYKWKKTFPGAGDAPKPAENLHPEKKTA